MWSFPVWKYRSDFRKMVYETNDWKINIKPYFWKEFQVLFGIKKRSSPKEQKTIRFYRVYLFVYFLLLGPILFLNI
jgi:hypothetical protein